MTFALAVPFAGAATLVGLTQKWFRLDNGEKDQAADGTMARIEDEK